MLVFAYALGATPFALLWSRVFALPDPRAYGSKNPGATNVARSGNKTAAILTLLCDSGKAAAAVWLAARFGGAAWLPAAAGLAAVVGHVAPVFLRFRGGRGVACAFGVLFAWLPAAGLAAAAAWAAVFALWRYSSAASLAAVFAGGGVCAALAPPAVAAAAAAVAVVVAVKHKDNIRRLVAKKESGF